MTDRLMHFEGGRDEAMKVGKMLDYPENMVDNLFYLLENPQDYKDCRELAKKFYTMDRCTLRLKDVIESLYQKYYG